MIISVTLVLYWLMRESDYLRVNLMSELSQYDIEFNFDNSDIEYLPDYNNQFNDLLIDITLASLGDTRYTTKPYMSTEQRIRNKQNFRDTKLYEVNHRDMYQNSQF